MSNEIVTFVKLARCRFTKLKAPLAPPPIFGAKSMKTDKQP